MKKNNIMKEEMRRQLVREVATYYIDTQTTIRKTAVLFGKSKSWVHRILKLEVKDKCPDLESYANSAIDVNKKARYLRGGLATKKKYEKQNQEE